MKWAAPASAALLRSRPRGLLALCPPACLLRMLQLRRPLPLEQAAHLSSGWSSPVRLRGCPLRTPFPLATRPPAGCRFHGTSGKNLPAARPQGGPLLLFCPPAPASSRWTVFPCLHYFIYLFVYLCVDGSLVFPMPHETGIHRHHGSTRGVCVCLVRHDIPRA